MLAYLSHILLYIVATGVVRGHFGLIWSGGTTPHYKSMGTFVSIVFVGLCVVHMMLMLTLLLVHELLVLMLMLVVLLMMSMVLFLKDVLVHECCSLPIYIYASLKGVVFGNCSFEYCTYVLSCVISLYSIGLLINQSLICLSMQ